MLGKLVRGSPGTKQGVQSGPRGGRDQTGLPRPTEASGGHRYPPHPATVETRGGGRLPEVRLHECRGGLEWTDIQDLLGEHADGGVAEASSAPPLAAEEDEAAGGPPGRWSLGRSGQRALRTLGLTLQGRLWPMRANTTSSRRSRVFLSFCSKVVIMIANCQSHVVLMIERR